MFEKLKNSGIRLKKEIEVFQLIRKDKRTPRISKILLTVAIGYTLLPFDIIPDFIPIIGQFDDLLIVPLLVIIALRMIPREVIEESQNSVMRKRERIPAPKLSLRFAKEYLRLLKQMHYEYSPSKQITNEDQIIKRSLWTSLIIEIGRIFDKDENSLSFKSICNKEVKIAIDKIHGEVIIGKIIKTRHSFTAHWGEKNLEVLDIQSICESNLEQLLNK